MSSSSSSSFSPPDHHQTLIQSSDQLCYVHCNFCDTVLAVSVPSSSLLKTVAVRCGHCTNLLSVNMRALLLPPSTHPPLSSLLEEISSGAPLNTMVNSINDVTVVSGEEQEQHQIPKMVQIQQPKRVDEMLNTFSKHHTSLLAVNRPPEKRQRIPSAYNRFIKEEIQRIKAGNPDISHREAFSAAAKNWAHLPHIHFGLMPADKQYQKPNLLPRQALQEADDEVVMAASR